MLVDCGWNYINIYNLQRNLEFFSDGARRNYKGATRIWEVRPTFLKCDS